jgi:uncharacterized protein YgbK (DUF1537 family)
VQPVLSSTPTGRSVGQAIACDDLSGACEVAGVLHESGFTTTVNLDPSVARAGPQPDRPTDPRFHRSAIEVIDLALREQPDEVARRAIERTVDDHDVRYIKIDSLLRGPIRGIVEGASSATRRPLLCSSLPSAGRTIVDGVPLVNGRPLSDSLTWQLEPRKPPTRVVDLLGSTPSREIGTSTRDVDLSADPPHSVLWADAATDDDLDGLAELTELHGLMPIGSAGLLMALARRNRPPTWTCAATTSPTDHVPVRAAIIAVGTASSVAHTQVAELRRAGTAVIELYADGPDGDASRAIKTHLGRDRPVVVRWSPATSIDPGNATRLAARLADVIADAATTFRHVPLVLTGGHTARTVLNNLSISQLDLRAVVHHGAVVTTTDTGRVVAIRPGSFGDHSSLERLSNTAISIALEENPSWPP